MMLMNLLMLAQEDPVPIEDKSLIFTGRNLLLIVGLVVLIVGFKIYKNKTMT